MLYLVILTSCAATGKKFESIKPIVEGKAKLVFYREYVWNGGFSCPTIKISGKKQDCLSNGGYFEADVNPGEVWIYLDSSYSTHKGSIVIDIKEGDTKFFEFDTVNRIGGAHFESLYERSYDYSIKKLKNLSEN